MIHYKLFGNVSGNNFEISLDWSRYLVGFGWIRLNKFKYVQSLSIHINIGPLAFILTLKGK